MSNINNELIVFESTEIRRTWHNEEWWFVVVDIVEVLTDSSNPSSYLKDIRRRDSELSNIWGGITNLLSVETQGGKQRMNCANIEGIFRIIQSIPSSKAEPFKQWLARVGYERVQEIENPELGVERIRQYYRELGYSDDWIAARLKSIEVRGMLTDEWKNRDVKEGMEYAILTSEISKATFGVKPSDYKNYKGLNRENLRDHMNNRELIFTMLGEEQTRLEAIKDDAQGFEENKYSAVKGGEAAGDALDAFEKRTGDRVKSPNNFLDQIKAAKEKKKLERKLAKDKNK